MHACHVSNLLTGAIAAEALSSDALLLVKIVPSLCGLAAAHQVISVHAAQTSGDSAVQDPERSSRSFWTRSVASKRNANPLAVEQIWVSFRSSATAQGRQCLSPPRRGTACREYQHFQQRTSLFGRHEGLGSKRTLTWVSFAAGGCFVVWVTNREEIPYTGRKHCILVPTSMEQSIGQNTFQQVCLCIFNPHHLRIGAVN